MSSHYLQNKQSVRAFLFAILVILFFGMSACRSYTYNCTDSSLSTTFIGFTQAEIDTFYLRQYVANTTYSSLLKTDTVGRSRNLSLYQRNDSIDAFTYGVQSISAGSDWELIIPAVNKTIRISNIVSEKRQGKKTNTIFSFGPGSCINPIYSAQVDNTLLNFSESNLTIYIRK